MADAYRNVFYLSTGICCLFNSKTGDITDANANFERHFRMSHEAAVTRKFIDFIEQNNDREYFESVVRGLNSSKVHHDLDEIEVVVSLANGVIIYANEALLNILGYTAEEYIGHQLVEFLVDTPAILRMVHRIGAGEVVHNYSYLLYARDGSVKACLADSDMKFNADGSKCHSRTYLRYDVDRMVEQALAYERIAKLGTVAAEKDRFIRIIFHEIRTPLHNLSTRISNSLRQSNMPQHIMDEMRYQVESVSGLVEDLSFATMFESDQVLHPRPVNIKIKHELDSIIQQINLFYEAELTKKSIKIQKIVDVHLPEVIAVDKSILRVLNNLLHNAVKFCCPMGTVLISLSFDDSVTADEGRSNFTFTVTNSVTKPMDLVLTNRLFQSCFYQGCELTSDGGYDSRESTSNNNSWYNTPDDLSESSKHGRDSPLGLPGGKLPSPSQKRVGVDSPLPRLRGPGTGNSGQNPNPLMRVRNSTDTPPNSPRHVSPARRTESPVQRLRHDVTLNRSRTDSGSNLGEFGNRMNLSVDVVGTPPALFAPLPLKDIGQAPSEKLSNISSTLVSNEGLGLGLFVSYNIIQSLGGLLECAGTEKESCFTFSIHVESVKAVKITPVTGQKALKSIFGSKTTAWSSVSSSSIGSKHLDASTVPAPPPPVTPASSSSSNGSSHTVHAGAGAGVTVPMLPIIITPRRDSPRGGGVGPAVPSTPSAAVAASLPPGAPDLRRSSSSSNESTSGRFPRLARILVVDDSPICRKVLVKSLEAAGYVTDTACDGQEAVDKLSAAPSNFDLVLMDLRMPIMDGLTATRICKAKPHLALVPIVIVTAEMGEEIRQAAMEANASHFISKPAKVKELLEVMQGLIKW